MIALIAFGFLFSYVGAALTFSKKPGSVLGRAFGVLILLLGLATLSYTGWFYYSIEFEHLPP